MVDENVRVRNLEAINNASFKEAFFESDFLSAELVGSLNKQEKEFAQKLRSMAEKANHWVSVVQEAFQFEHGQDRVRVYNSGEPDASEEYFTHEGEWKRYHKNTALSAMCTPEAIFELLKADYLVTHGIVDGHSNDLMSLFEIDIQQRAYVASYFIAFLERTEGILKKTKRSIMREQG